MKKDHKRRGLFLIWTAISISVVLLLGGGLLSLIGTSARAMRKSQDHVTAILLGQEVMETVKSNARLHTHIPIPQEAVRNQKTFQIKVDTSVTRVDGISLDNVVVTVVGGEETVKLQSLLGKRRDMR